ncbi:hypothetical protein NUU61_002272 [Penicillium alfredii]|uniref:Uncharacterized protein n=1 Tax=Penicillium alfredii TaxID=1506179 RepID=A0A9W9KFV3_9EURO|nr:uncharacterized protein NUU61_002272 [Penicillium alfredii]KAJ5104925.1 hypothetical protein NUU61_002272 [Penicillium alfredii]
MARPAERHLVLAFVLLLVYATHTLAQPDPPAKEGWKFDDNSRSSWDILWTCVSTIFACTWTTLHMPLPKRDETDVVHMCSKLMAWIYAILAPELFAVLAAEDLWQARSVAARCNAAFLAVESENADASSSWSETPAAQTATNPANRWRATTDEWTFPVQPGNVVPLIQAGVVKPSHLRARDIEDRAKADSFAKAFTILQSSWIACNVIARKAYGLPISALEISTVAYVVCAAITYAVLWHKPKDMVTPIVIPFPYKRNDENMPGQIMEALDESYGRWMHISDTTTDQTTPMSDFLLLPLMILIFPVVMTQAFFRSNMLKRTIRKFRNRRARHLSPSENTPPMSEGQTRDKEAPRDEEAVQEGEGPSNEPRSSIEETEKKSEGDQELLTVRVQVQQNQMLIVTAVAFCGIHVAAWNSSFPTKAEQIAWRVFSLVALGMAVLYYLASWWQDIELWRKWGPDGRHQNGITQPWTLWDVAWISTVGIFYSIARWGNLILMFVALRALPPGSYTTINWMSTIPHI